MRDWVIFMAGWLSVWGVQNFEETAAKAGSMVAAVAIYAICVFAWRKAG